MPAGRFRTARERAGMVDPPAIDPDPLVRPHLVDPIFNLCAEAGIRRTNTRVNQLNDRGVRMCVAVGITGSWIGDLRQQVESEPDLLIDLVDWLISERLRALANHDHEYNANRVENWLASVEQLLDTGGSAWTVDRGLPGLSLRVSNEERATYDVATSVADSATDYLREAWAAAWGVSPNGDLAYAKAVDALEAAFRREVCPKDDGASLGEIARDLGAKPEKWAARLADARPQSDDRRRPHAGVSLLGESLGIIFSANHRHGATDDHLKNSLDDGRDAVTMAAALIAMQRRGFLRRASDR